MDNSKPGAAATVL